MINKLKRAIHYKLRRPKEIYYDVLFDTFIKRDYRFLLENIKPNTIALDIGAYIGDTAIFLASHPYIKKVYSYEANRQLYNIAVKNIESSGLENKIELNNKAITIHGESTAFYNVNDVTPAGKIDTGMTQVPACSLQDILKNLEGNIIMKMDIEGAEHQIFERLFPKDIKKISKMQIEYHDLWTLPEDLNYLGFDYRIIKADVNNSIYDEIGMIYAQRR